MPAYFLLSTLSADGARSLRANPSRVQLDNARLEKLGAHVVGQWAVLGAYDFVTLIEAPDERVAKLVSVELAARSSAKVESLPTMPIDVFLERLSPEDPE